MSTVKMRGVPPAKNKVAFYPHGKRFVFGGRSGLGLNRRLGGQGALATSGDPDKVGPKKWVPRVGKTTFFTKSSVSRRRNPYFLSLPI